MWSTGTDMLIVRELTGGLYYGTPRGIDADGGALATPCRIRARRSSASLARRFRAGAESPQESHQRR